jgi:hypothetical protein
MPALRRLVPDGFHQGGEPEPMNDIINRYRHHQISKGQTVFEIRLNDSMTAQLPEGTLADFAVALDALLDGYFGEYA